MPGILFTSGPVNRVVEIAATGVDAPRSNAPVNTKRKGALYIPPASESPVYDADGNLTSDARWDYTWDGENRLIAQVEKAGIPTVVAPGISMPATTTRTSLEFSYDAQGRRISKRVYTATNGGSFVLKQSLVCLYDGWNMIAEIDSSSGLLRSYEWGTDMSGTMSGAGGVGGLLVVRSHAGPTSGMYAPCYDGNGNVTELINLANGSVSARYEYGAFGETISMDGGAVAEANPFRFSTKYLDAEAGLYNYGYRYYDAANGRWLCRDPIAERGGINLYGMINNSLLNKWDYLGLAYPRSEAEPQPDVLDQTKLGPENGGYMGEESWFDGFYPKLMAGARSYFIGKVNTWIVTHCGEKQYSSKLKQSIDPEKDPAITAEPWIWSDKQFGDPGQTTTLEKYGDLGHFNIVVVTPIAIRYKKSNVSGIHEFEWKSWIQIEDVLGLQSNEGGDGISGDIARWAAPERNVIRARWSIQGVGACCLK